MSVEIREVRGRRDLSRFVRFPLELYRGHACYVPDLLASELRLLSPAKNPSFEYCRSRQWLAFRNGRIVGRIAGIVNERFVEKWERRWARFGWIDFVDDREVSAALLRAAEAWAREQGMEGLQGPMGFTDLDKEGMLVEGFDELGTLPMIYNHAYYPEHLEALGYRKDVDWLEFQVFTPEKVPERLERLEHVVLQRTGTHLLRAKSAREIRPHVPGLFEVLNAAYADLYGVVELTPAQVRYYTDEFFGFIQPEYTKLVLDPDDRVVAFGVCMPSLSRALQKAHGRLLPFGWWHLLRALRNPRVLDFYLIAVSPEYQNRGVHVPLFTEITRACIRNGIEYAETAGELETNTKVQSLWKDYEVRQHKRRRVYVKQW